MTHWSSSPVKVVEGLGFRVADAVLWAFLFLANDLGERHGGGLGMWTGHPQLLSF